MGFDRFGFVSFTADTKVSDFAVFLEQGKVMTTKCRGCGNITFPPRKDCPACSAENVEWVEICGPGKLETFTEVRYGPAGFEGEVPFVLGIVAFSIGIKMLGHIDREVPFSEISVGLGLEVVPVRLNSGRYSYLFRKPSIFTGAR